MKIRINTNINAPCCPCEIVAEDGRSHLVQTDWDFPSVASSFGWSLAQVQDDDGDHCDHDGTDGTIDCKCGITASRFIGAAREFLENNDGLEVDDPGYFE